MGDEMTSVFDDISVYYSEKIAQFGAPPQGVDWNSEEIQAKKSEQLCNIIDIRKKACSINDLACGHGALLSFLPKIHAPCSYLGVDISLEMIKLGEPHYAEFRQAHFISCSMQDQIADYRIASGLLNVRLGRNDAEWPQYLQLALDLINETSHDGFAFNGLT
jgi:ubiquinone/menaquinone biosynthesis C-methylase UbiE